MLAAHLRDEHYAAQLLERLAWATNDAEELEGGERSRSYTSPLVSYLGPRA